MLTEDKVLKQMAHWHTLRGRSFSFGDLQAYQTRRTAGGKYTIQFLYGYTINKDGRPHHPKIGNAINFSSFKNWLKGIEIAEEYMNIRAAELADDFTKEELL